MLKYSPTSTRKYLPRFFFSFNNPPPPEIYTLSLHDALPISSSKAISSRNSRSISRRPPERHRWRKSPAARRSRSEEHTSELQSRENLVCRLLLEKKKTTTNDKDQLQRTDSSLLTPTACQD